MASEPDSFFFSLSAEIRNNIYALIFEHEDPIYVIQADKSLNPVLHRYVGDRNRDLINPRKCRSRPSCYTTLVILTLLDENSKSFWSKFDHSPVGQRARHSQSYDPCDDR
jgi:hypothetical protein